LHPVPTHGGAHLVVGSHHLQGPVEQRDIEARADVLSYTSDELEADLEVTGWVTCELWVASTAPCTDFTARLSDVHPDGRSISVCDGIVRVALTPGDDTRVEIRLGATSQVFRRGHCVRLSVSSSNSPRFDVNPNTGHRAFDEHAPVVAEQSVFHDAARPSRVVLPVVPS
jgi:putative CocE/NonD family hydrolase